MLKVCLSILEIIFQNIFYLEIYQKNILKKNIFNIRISKINCNYKKKLKFKNF
jgi:hypothetical protein